MVARVVRGKPARDMQHWRELTVWLWAFMEADRDNNRRGDLPAILGIGLTSIEAARRLPLSDPFHFPEPIPLSLHGRIVVFLQSEVEEWMRRCVAARGADSTAMLLGKRV